MKRALRTLTVLAGFFITMFSLGPRPQLNLDGPSAQPRSLPSDRSAFDDFLRTPDHPKPRDGTEARILWADCQGATTPISVVSLHGFSASRQEMAPLPERVAGRLKANLLEVRLTGHGQSGAALGRARAEDWIRDVREAVLLAKAIGRRVVVLAASTGATAMTLVAVRDQPEVFAYVYFSPNFGLRNQLSKLFLWPWSRRWLPLAVGPERAWEPANERQAMYWTSRYPVDVLFELMATVRGARQAEVERMEAPLRVFFHPDDPVVNPDGTWDVFGRWGSSEKRMTPVRGPGDKHVLAGTALAPDRTDALIDEVVAWIQSLSKRVPSPP